MQKLLYTCIVFLFTATPLSAAVFVVTNTNNQGPGSLREAIENLNAFGGITNEITVSLIDGKITVVLLSELPSITKHVVFDGFDQVSGQPIVIDGNGLASYGLHLSGVDASNSVITNVVVKNMQAAGLSATAMGIGIEDSASWCSIVDCTAHDIFAVGSESRAVGIFVDRVLGVGPLVGNSVSNVQADGENALASGIASFVNIQGDCSANTISNIATASNFDSGQAVGISLVGFIGSCQKNVIQNIHSGDVLLGSSGLAGGIGVSSDMSGNILDNTITNITSGSAEESGNVFGIELSQGIDGSVQRNIINNLASGSSFRGGSGDVVGINSNGDLAGNGVQNNLSYFVSGSAVAASGRIDGLRVDGTAGLVAHNIIEHFESGEGGSRSGEIKGIDLQNGTIRCAYNTIRYLTAGTAPSSGNIEAIEFDGVFIGDCNNNVIHDLLVTSTTNDAPDVVGIQAENGFIGNILNNSIYNLSSQGSTGGIDVQGETESELIACNSIYNLAGESASGITLATLTGATITNNHITNLHAAAEDALGLAGLLNTSLITNNKIAAITSDVQSGVGIQLKDPSSGNDILTNSVFDITTKAIDIDFQTDVQSLTLSTVRCSAGNRIGVTGVLVPEATLAGRTFLIQFFVSDTDNPEQIKTFIGQCEHDSSISSNFDCSFVVKAPTQFGQFITATATALSDGTQENINTSEVSNALFACETSGGVCTIATCADVPKPEPRDVCSLLGICSVNDIL